MWKIFKELTGGRRIGGDNQTNVYDLNKCSVRQSSELTLLIYTGLKNSRAPVT